MRVQGSVGSGSRLLAWRPASLEPFGPVQTRRAQRLDLGLARGLSEVLAGWEGLGGPGRAPVG